MSGGQIGGIVGAGVGALLALPTGGMSVAWGAQIGYALGSAIGGYVDPMRVKGPQITDAASQTSSVGMPLPFGYGTFATSGNVIWADELKEHVKRQRQGKGGGAKTTTYTYTRSYAIGVCEGPIYGFLMIRRNGKTVYNSDPNAPVADKDYSAKWLQRATLYYGDETQMPDSTIEAVEGAGNVSAFRGLAYIVIENEDLTDLAGAVPQYEFIVQATSVGYMTTRPYRVVDMPEMASIGSSEYVCMEYPPTETTLIGISGAPESIQLKLMRDSLDVITGEYGCSGSPESISLESTRVYIDSQGPGEMQSSGHPESISLEQSRVRYNKLDPQVMQSAGQPVSIEVEIA